MYFYIIDLNFWNLKLNLRNISIKLKPIGKIYSHLIK